MYSFYGGRPGNSFVIITTYRSVADMVNYFKQGPNYTSVHYDQYVMINTVNKNNPENGRIYRRGYNFTNSDGGAIFIGTIVGPSGHAPMLEMTTYADVKNKHAAEGYEERFAQGDFNVPNGSLVPGKKGNGTQDTDFNDTIKWRTCSIRTADNKDAIAYVGFVFPYTVIDFTSDGVQPYQNGIYHDNTVTERVDNMAHPFYEKFHIKVPHGVKGDAIKNLHVEVAGNDIEEYTGKADDVNNQREVLVYTYYNYDYYQNGNPKKIYLGDYNMIEDVTMNDEGLITVKYTHDNDKNLQHKVKWINSVELNTTTGHFKITYNQKDNGNPVTYETDLDWIDNVNLAADGTLTFHHTHAGDQTVTPKLKWISNIEIADDGQITVNYNTGDSDALTQKVTWITGTELKDDGTLEVTYNNDTPTYSEQKVRWINDARLKNDGTLGFKYNFIDGEEETEQDYWVDLQNQIKWIDSIEIADDGQITINYNYGDPDQSSHKVKWIKQMSIDTTNGDTTITWNDDTTTPFAKLIKWISGMSIADNGAVTLTWNDGTTSSPLANPMKWIKNVAVNSSGNQKLRITWNDNTGQDIGDPINYILSMAVNENNHLIVRYSDPLKQGTISYGDYNNWTDLGLISQQYEYDAGSTISGLSWVGVGQLIDTGSGNKKVRFTVNPSAFINKTVNRVILTAGTLNGSNGTDTINSLNMASLNITTITKQLTGLQFEVSTAIASSGAAATDFINLSITGMGLSFSTVTA